MITKIKNIKINLIEFGYIIFYFTFYTKIVKYYIEIIIN